MSLVQVEDLRVSFSTRAGPVHALHGVSLSIADGQTLGIVGESGSGKSVTAYAITRLLDKAGRITAGRILFRGTDLTRVPERDLRLMRGADMSMIFQNPRAALNPIAPIGRQITDAILAHRRVSAVEARTEALSLLRAVLIRDPEVRFHSYPHELSGGMCQRVMIAMAIACQPKLLIADEPTTGLDVTTQKQVMDLLARITADRGMAMMLITHDLALAAQYCQNIVVLERGRIVEEGETGKLFHSPQHPYTRRLVAASPTPRSTVEDLARAAAAAGEVIHARPSAMRLAAPVDTGPLLDVRNLVKKFGVLSPAVDDVSFSIHAGGSLGLVGESGSGKSTISRMVCRLLDKTDGDIFFDGQDIGNVPVRDFHKMPPRRDIQLVFQDPDNSLNPRFTAFDCIAHPLRTLARNRSEATIATQVHEVAARCGLPMDLLGRFPHQLSGGQKARVGIARAIAPRPRLLVLDEPTAALDVSVQAIILNLLLRLRHEDGTAFLFVSHDLNVVRLMCEHVVVLQLGQVVEQGEVNAVFKSPTSEYTRELLAAIPHFDPTRADKVRVSNG